MDWSAWILVATALATTVFMVQQVGFNFSLSSILLSLLLAFHTAAYLYYTRVWAIDSEFFDTIVSSARGAPVVQTLDIAMCIVLVGICIGVKLSDFVTRTSGPRMKRAVAGWTPARQQFSPAQRGRVHVAVLLAVMFMLPFMVIDSQLQKVFEFATADLGEHAKIELRREGGGSSVYLYNLLVGNLFPFVAFCIVASWSSRRPLKGGLVWLFLGLLLVAKAASLSKAPPAVLLIQLAAVAIMAGRLEISLALLLRLMAITVALFGAMTVIANPTLEGLGLIGEFLFYRVFMIVNESLVEYFSAIPHVIDFAWGSQFSWVAALLQDHPREPTYWLVAEVHRGQFNSTTTAMFLGDAWADFAWLGVIVSPVILGLLVRTIDHRLIIVRGKSVLSVAALAVGHFGIFTALNTSLQTAMFTGGLLLALPFVYLLDARTRASRTQSSRSRHATYGEP